jgi:hypothetical protein
MRLLWAASQASMPRVRAAGAGCSYLSTCASGLAYEDTSLPAQLGGLQTRAGGRFTLRRLSTGDSRRAV